MTMFSVAITLASSRKTLAPTDAVGAHVVCGVGLDLDAERGQAVNVRVEPAPADHVSTRAARRSRPLRERGADRRAGTTPGSACRAPRRAPSCECSATWTRTSFGPVHSTSAPRSLDQRRASSRRRGCAGRSCSVTGSSVSRHAARIGSAPFLLPGGADAAVEGAGRPRSRRTLSLHWQRPFRPWARGYRTGAVELTRDRAWETLTRYTKSEALLRHALAVEASVSGVRAEARRRRGALGRAALLHDFDYEIHPTLDKHPQDGAPILREEGYPEVVIEGVLSHAEHLALPRDTPLKKTLFACDELSGFVHACGSRSAGRARGARAEVGQEEAQAAVVRGRGSP